MAKPTVYIPNAVADALSQLYPGVSTSALVGVGLIHVLARGPELTPSDRVRAAVTIERMRRVPNRDLIAAAEHALRTRKAQAFVERHLPGGGVAF